MKKKFGLLSNCAFSSFSRFYNRKKTDKIFLDGSITYAYFTQEFTKRSILSGATAIHWDGRYYFFLSIYLNKNVNFQAEWRRIWKKILNRYLEQLINLIVDKISKVIALKKIKQNITSNDQTRKDPWVFAVLFLFIFFFPRILNDLSLSLTLRKNHYFLDNSWEKKND